MNKLQLYITKSLRGFKSLINFNPDEDVRCHIHDIRHALKIPAYDTSEKNVFYMLSRIPRGAFITVIRTIPPGTADHLAAWLYIPDDAVIDPDSLLHTVALVTRKVAASTLSTDDISELREALSVEYGTDTDCPRRAMYRGEDIAFRYYGDGTPCSLSDLIGTNLYQTTYTPFAAVLLIDRSLGIAARGTDLTDAPLCRMAVVYPPESDPGGFTPYVFDEEFNEPMLLPLNTEIDVTWRRQGFEDVHQNTTIDSDGLHLEGIATGRSRKTLTQRSFSVTALTSRQNITEQCIITVNGVVINQPRPFSLAELANASVTVACDGFYTYSARIDLASATQAIIQLRERQKTYNFEIPARSADIGGMIQFTIHCKNELDESPVEGYSLTEEIQEGASRNNHLIYSGGSSRASTLTRAIYAIAGIVAGILLGSLLRCDPHDTPDISAADTIMTRESADTAAIPVAINANSAIDTVPATPAIPSEPARSLDEAVRYLDANKVWVKATMDSFPDLAGLYDDLNTIERHRLVEVWGPKLNESRSFRLIVEHARLSYRKKARLKAGRTTFNRPDEQSINIQSYLNTIDP